MLICCRVDFVPVPFQSSDAATRSRLRGSRNDECTSEAGALSTLISAIVEVLPPRFQSWPPFKVSRRRVSRIDGCCSLRSIPPGARISMLSWPGRLKFASNPSFMSSRKVGPVVTEGARPNPMSCVVRPIPAPVQSSKPFMRSRNRKSWSVAPPVSPLTYCRVRSSTSASLPAPPARFQSMLRGYAFNSRGATSLGWATFGFIPPTGIGAIASLPLSLKSLSNGTESISRRMSGLVTDRVSSRFVVQ